MLNNNHLFQASVTGRAKRFLMAFCLCVGCVCHAQSLVIQIDCSYFLANPSTSRQISWQAQSPTIGNIFYTFSDPVTGIAYITNPPIALINCVIQSPPGQRIPFQIQLLQGDSGTIDATNRLASGSATTYPAGQTSWAIATSDTRYALSTNQAGFYPSFGAVTQIVNSIASSNTLASVTNGFDPLGAAKLATNLFTSIVYSNPASFDLSGAALGRQAGSGILSNIVIAGGAYTNINTAGANFTLTTNAASGVVTMTANSQTNGFTSIVLSNPAAYYQNSNPSNYIQANGVPITLTNLFYPSNNPAGFIQASSVPASLTNTFYSIANPSGYIAASAVPVSLTNSLYPNSNPSGFITTNGVLGMMTTNGAQYTNGFTGIVFVPLGYYQPSSATLTNLSLTGAITNNQVAGPNMTLTTNLGVVTFTANSQTNGFTSIVLSNPASFYLVSNPAGYVTTNGVNGVVSTNPYVANAITNVQGTKNLQLFSQANLLTVPTNFDSNTVAFSYSQSSSNFTSLETLAGSNNAAILYGLSTNYANTNTAAQIISSTNQSGSFVRNNNGQATNLTIQTGLNFGTWNNFVPTTNLIAVFGGGASGTYETTPFQQVWTNQFNMAMSILLSGSSWFIQTNFGAITLWQAPSASGPWAAVNGSGSAPLTAYGSYWNVWGTKFVGGVYYTNPNNLNNIFTRGITNTVSGNNNTVFADTNFLATVTFVQSEISGVSGQTNGITGTQATNITLLYGGTLFLPISYSGFVFTNAIYTNTFTGPPFANGSIFIPTNAGSASGGGATNGIQQLNGNGTNTTLVTAINIGVTNEQVYNSLIVSNAANTATLDVSSIQPNGPTNVQIVTPSGPSGTACFDNVGIATYNSLFGHSTFSVWGNVQIAGFGITNAGNAAQNVCIGQNIDANQQDDFVFNSGGLSRFQVPGGLNNAFLVNASSGVGIDTNNPEGFSLNVNGTANFSAVLVNGTNLFGLSGGGGGGGSQTPWTSDINGNNFSLTNVQAVGSKPSAGLWPWIQFTYAANQNTPELDFDFDNASFVMDSRNFNGVNYSELHTGGGGNVLLLNPSFDFDSHLGHSDGNGNLYAQSYGNGAASDTIIAQNGSIAMDVQTNWATTAHLVLGPTNNFLPEDLGATNDYDVSLIMGQFNTITDQAGADLIDVGIWGGSSNTIFGGALTNRFDYVLWSQQSTIIDNAELGTNFNHNAILGGINDYIGIPTNAWTAATNSSVTTVRNFIAGSYNSTIVQTNRIGVFGTNWIIAGNSSIISNANNSIGIGSFTMITNDGVVEINAGQTASVGSLLKGTIQLNAPNGAYVNGSLIGSSASGLYRIANESASLPIATAPAMCYTVAGGLFEKTNSATDNLGWSQITRDSGD